MILHYLFSDLSNDMLMKLALLTVSEDLHHQYIMWTFPLFEHHIVPEQSRQYTEIFYSPITTKDLNGIMDTLGRLDWCTQLIRID